MAETKRGIFSTEEVEFIQANCMTMTAEAIGLHLNRNPKTIQKKIDAAKANVLIKVESEDNIFEYELRKKPYWIDLQKSYSDHELKIYQHHWGKLMSQFREDITHTEEMQILKVIDLEIGAFRNLAERQNTDDQISNVEKELERELVSGTNIQLIMNMRNQIMALKASQQSRSKEYNDITTKQQAMMRDLKSTRDQRLEKIETGKTTFWGWLRQHLENKELLRKDSQEAELARIAMKKAKADLSEYHTYADGQVDQPFLNADTIKEDNK